MVRMSSVLLCVAFTLAAAGCPDRKDAIEQAGGAAGRQVDDARVRIDRAEDKILKQAAAADAIAAPE